MKGFTLKMIGFDIPIDEDEIPKIIDGIQKGEVRILKQGIMKPSSFSGIIEDKKREQEKEIDEENHYTGKLSVKPLKDLFPSLRKDLEKLTQGVKLL